jgi:transcription-repair coupling factor (superfamily II helicase)
MMYRIVATAIIVFILFIGFASYSSLFNIQFDDTDQTTAKNEKEVELYNTEEMVLNSELDGQVKNEEENTELDHSDQSETIKNSTNENNSSTADELKGVAEKFFEEMIQPTDDQYKVINFSSKQKLVEYLEKYASTDLVSYYVDGLYEEKNGNLYIIPMDGPPWINQDKPIEFIEEDAENYALEQINDSGLYGTYKIRFDFQGIQGEWIITDVTVQQK